MRIISTNTGKIKIIRYKGKTIRTGIYKNPVAGPVYLERLNVSGDHIADLKVHGGADKACYLFSSGHYPYWKERFPHLDWKWGMFGENLTVEGLDESKINIGDIFQIGEALVQASQPRLPCFKLGIRFGTPRMVKYFQEYHSPGVYVRILKEGHVSVNDELILKKRREDGISVNEVFSLFSINKHDKSLRQKALDEPFLAESIKKDLRKMKD